LRVLDPIFLTVLLCSGNITPATVGARTHPIHPNERPRPHYTTPTPTSPTWKSLKSASMSRQRRRMALSASNDVAGTWERFSAAFSSTLCLPITPLRHPTIPYTPEAQEVPKHTGGQKPPACFLSFKALQHQHSGWNKQIQPQTPPRRRKLVQNTKMPPASPKKCFGASWRCQRRSGTYLRPISTAPTPRESNETPWKVSRY